MQHQTAIDANGINVCVEAYMRRVQLSCRSHGCSSDKHCPRKCRPKSMTAVNLQETEAEAETYRTRSNYHSPRDTACRTVHTE